jgi:hypothetical protein
MADYVLVGGRGSTHWRPVKVMKYPSRSPNRCTQRSVMRSALSSGIMAEEPPRRRGLVSGRVRARPFSFALMLRALSCVALAAQCGCSSVALPPHR